MKKYEFRPQYVCSTMMSITLDGDIIKKVKVVGGCSGNSQGVSRLLEGMTVDDAINKLYGIRCGAKPTSCPDQLARGLMKIKEGTLEYEEVK